MRLLKLIVISILSFYLIQCAAFSEDYNRKSRGDLQYDWTKEETWHFRIYYRNADRKYIEELKDKAERYYWKLDNEVGLMHLQWKGKIYVYDNKEDYMTYTGQPEWSLGCANVEKSTIKSFSGCKGFFTNILPHELGHLVLHEYLGGRNVPLCLHEGVAQYLEETKARRNFKNVIKRALQKESFFPLAELFDITSSELAAMEENDIRVFYAESVGIVEYLIRKHGTIDFSRFLQRLKESGDLQSALRWGFDYNSISELNEEWLRSL